MKKILLSLLTLYNFIGYGQTWQAAANIPVPIRAGNTAAYSKNGDGFLFVVSGRDNNGNITPKHQRYQMSTNSWTDLADHPTGILGAATAILKDSLYVIGGLRTTPGSAWRRVYKYSINENTWSQAANFPVNLVDAKAVAYQDSLIYITGGYTGNTYVYNSHYNRWRTATPVLPGGSLSWFGFSVQDNTLVMLCGTDGFLSSNYYNTVRKGVIDQTDRSQITWTEGTPFPGATRTFFDAQLWKDGVIMTGGSTDNTFETHSDECYVYDVRDDSWQMQPSKPTSWLTGNSGSVQHNGEWSLICSSGFGTGYLSQTEIFSAVPLSTTENLANNCEWKDFKVVYGKYLTLRFCYNGYSKIDLKITDHHGRIVRQMTDIASGKGTQDVLIEKDSLPKGIYYCSLQNQEAVVTRKIIVY